jgi:serine/threonine protein kinase
MPPEQCAPADHPGEIGSPSDIWGLGATLYHALSGTVPFPRHEGARNSEDPLVRFPQLVEEATPLPDRVADPLRMLIMGMLARRPQDRPTAAEVVEDLEPLVAELPRRLFFGRRGTRLR